MSRKARGRRFRTHFSVFDGMRERIDDSNARNAEQYEALNAWIDVSNAPNSELLKALNEAPKARNDASNALKAEMNRAQHKRIDIIIEGLRQIRALLFGVMGNLLDSRSWFTETNRKDG